MPKTNLVQLGSFSFHACIYPTYFVFPKIPLEYEASIARCTCGEAGDHARICQPRAHTAFRRYFPNFEHFLVKIIPCKLWSI
jgi:hypothetical protein